MIENISLNSYWKFITDESNEGINKNWHKVIPEQAENIWVPSCWNELREELLHYEGIAWYFKKFVYRAQDNVKRNVLFFHGVNYKCEVWMNGFLAGSHTGGFTPFEIDVTDYLVKDGENLITVRVDSTINEMTTPPIGVDWFNYGGIFRDVFLNGTGDLWFDDVTVVTKADGKVHIAVEVNGAMENKDYQIDMLISDADAIHPVFCNCVTANTSESNHLVNIKNPKLWSPENPFLYDFKLVLKRKAEILDIWEHRIGIREFSIKDRKILLNGSPIMLRGYSKHEEYPMHGRTFSYDILRKDYEMCKQGNANFLRLCHYPHHLKEYEIASENGFLVICEMPNVNFKKEQFLNTDLMQLAVDQMKEVVKYYKNETCILFWSLFVECKTYEDAAVDFVPKYIKLAKELDPTRFTIHASDIPTEDRTYDYFDVVGVNYWFGWYRGDTLESGSKMLDTIAGRYPEKPVVMTSGGWEGIYGQHSYKAKMKWSEESQAEYLEKLTEMYLSKEYIVGEIVWTFNDFRVSPWIVSGAAMWPARPMEINHKGVVDYFRRPKLSYYKLQETFKKWDFKK